MVTRLLNFLTSILEGKNNMATKKPNQMKRMVVKNLVERCKREGKRAKDIAKELKMAGYKVFVASFCMCEDVVFFDTDAGLHIRIFA